MNLIAKVSKIPHGIKSITEWLGQDGAVESPEVSEQRAKTCSTCIRNVEGWFLTDQVAKAVKRHLEVRNALKLSTSYDNQIDTCAICSCNLKLLVHEPIARVKAQLTEDELTKSPENCWKLTERV